MIAQTKRLLDKFAVLNLFANVGDPLEVKDAKQVLDWNAAIKSCKHPVSRWARMEGQNLFTIQLHSRCLERYRQWNSIVDEMRGVIDPLLGELYKPKVQEVSLPPEVGHCLQWQLLGACMESEYDDYYSFYHFRKDVDLYFAGHFPCGWELSSPEEFPDRSTRIFF
jgi:hypothetical protein